VSGIFYNINSSVSSQSKSKLSS